MAVDPRAPHRTALLRLAGNTPHGQPGGLSAQPNRSLRSSNTPAPARNPPAKPRPPASRTEGDRPQGCAVDFTRCAARPRSVTKPELPRRPPTPGPARLIVHHDRPSPPPATASAVGNVAAWVEPCAEAEPCHWSAPASTYHQSSVVCELQRLAPRPRGLALCSKPASESSWAVHRERVHCGVKPI